MVFVKKSNFLSSVFFWANQARKDCFGRPDKKRMLFKPEKGSFKKRQKSKFSKLVGAWFLSKNRPFLSSVFFGQNKPERIVF